MNICRMASLYRSQPLLRSRRTLNARNDHVDQLANNPARDPVWSHRRKDHPCYSRIVAR